MRTLSVYDVLFLCLERHKQPMHFSALCVFELPKDVNTQNFIQEFINHTVTPHPQPTFPFDQILSGLGWASDPNFDIGQHFFYHHLPNDCNDIGQVFTYISHQHAQQLPKNRPLWQFHLIDGIAPKDDRSPARFAIWVKMHHMIADGVAGMRLLQQSLCINKDATASLPFWATIRPKPIHHQADFPALLKQQYATLKPVGRELWQGFKDKFNANHHFVSTFDTPKSILNQKITTNRLLFAQSFDKNRFVKLAKHFKVTVNDMVLAVCSGALRSYLLSQNALPEKPLIGFVPISLRRDKSASGNQISFLLTNLGTHLTNPKDRLNVIKTSIDNGKARFGRMNQAQIINYSLCAYGWAGLNLATGIAPTRQAFNLIISNVPADDSRSHLNGATLTGIYPASILFDGQALNITLTNHQNSIDFGFTACGDILPNIESLLMLMEKSLQDFENFFEQK